MPLVPGEWHTFHSVNMADIQIKGTSATSLRSPAGRGEMPYRTSTPELVSIELGGSYLSNSSGKLGTVTLNGNANLAAVQARALDSDAVFKELLTAFLNNTVVGFACMDKGITVAGAEGLWADCVILSFTREEPLEEGLTAKVKVKPTLSANAPVWKSIAAG